MITERFIERPVTEWDGVSVRVVVGAPSLSRTSQMIIGREDLDQLRYLVMPDELRTRLKSGTTDALDELHIFKREYELAKNVLESISGTIARSLCHAICKSLQEGDGRQI